ncbi:MAG TPA: PAS domain-containing protein [Flavisolibacter sp.]|nr:PAS domain-containing protein [Flavisolibacter sp.]
MEAKTINHISLDRLLYLPGFAAHLLDERLDEYVQKQLDYSFELNIPVLKYFLQMTEEERFALARQSSVEFLTYLANQQATELIRMLLEQWSADKLPVVDRDAIVAEDITMVNYVRKRAMTELLPGYTQNTDELLALVKEIDFLFNQLITTATNQYMNLFKARLEENMHFVQKVTETVPGAVYVFDVERFKGIYSNQKLGAIIGYEQAELNELGENAVGELLHPDDKILFTRDAILTSIADGQPRAIKYRIRTKDGRYKWLANYSSVFKQNTDGTPSQVIGITLDIDNEQKTVEELRNREELLLEAQQIAQLGNYYWDFEKDASYASAQTMELLEVESTNFEDFVQKVHPDDRRLIRDATDKALQTGLFNCQYRIVGKKGIKHIWWRGKVDFEADKPVGMNGTMMDITEQVLLIRQLEEADKRHKQTELLAHIGSYAWNRHTNDITWSDEMYRIYEADQTQAITPQFILEAILPADRELLERTIKQSTQTGQPFDFYYRIKTPSGKVKILHSRGNIQNDETGEHRLIVGTDQDVTEKQTLIRELRRSSSLYKQAESMAAMGNWNWDMITGKLEWTDHLYRIYGLEPQAEEITVEKFLGFVHLDDRAYVAQGIDELKKEASVDCTFRVITRDGTQKWLRSIAQVLKDENGKITSVIGSEQDVTDKQTLINKLEESQRLYKQAQSIAKIGNWTYDFRTKEAVWSDELFAIYEIPVGKPLTMDEWHVYLDKAEEERIKQYIIDANTLGKSFDVTHRIYLPGGKQKILHRKGEPVFDEAGNAVKLVGTTQDITEQFTVQHELAESQTFIRKITDATPSIIASYNVNTGRYTFVSEGLEKLLGYQVEELMTKGVGFFTDIIHPEDIDALLEKNAKALEEVNNTDKKDLVMEFTYRMKHSNGTYRWFHTYGTVFDTNAEGKVEHVLNISLDITEQKEAIETIREQEYFIQQIADASPTILYLFDVPTQSIAYINREAFFVLGYLPDEMIEEGSNITNLLYHEDDLHLLPARRQSQKNFQQVDSMIQYECRMKHKDGDYRWLLVREIVFKTDEKESITQIIGAALDITRRKDMERTILQNTHQLEQSNASLEEFAYVASHDLKEPLRKISTFGDRLMASQMDKLSDDGKMYLRKIVDASQRMQNMISDLLSISMISGNKAFERTSLQQVLEDTLQTLEFKIEQRKAVIRYDALPEANVVPSQFRQLFQNLISNSLKFVREGVQPLITIHCTQATADDINSYQLAPASTYLKISFADNGIGFENEYAQKIFAIFHRLHGRSEYEGSGIGLAICKKIVEHHGGVIFATGQPDEGATFTIIIPA